MPTPMPNPTTMTQLQQNLSDIIQQGIIGVLLLIGITSVIIAASVFVFLWSRRNRPPPIDPTAGLNIALTGFASIIDNDRKVRKEENAAALKQNKELQEAYIESISANADATNRIADNHDKLIALWQSEIGSKPYQGLIETAARIETSVDTIVKKLQPAEKEAQKKQVQDIQKSIDELKQFVVTIVQNLQTDKRATGSLRPVTTSGAQDSIDDK